MKKKKTTIPSIIKWVIALILVVMQVTGICTPVKMGADKLYQCFYKKPYADLF